MFQAEDFLHFRNQNQSLPLGGIGLKRNPGRESGRVLRYLQLAFRYLPILGYPIRVLKVCFVDRIRESPFTRP